MKLNVVSEILLQTNWSQVVYLPVLVLLENATALGSLIPPHAVLLHVNNTPVKLKFIFAI